MVTQETEELMVHQDKMEDLDLKDHVDKRETEGNEERVARQVKLGTRDVKETRDLLDSLENR